MYYLICFVSFSSVYYYLMHAAYVAHMCASKRIDRSCVCVSVTLHGALMQCWYKCSASTGNGCCDRAMQCMTNDEMSYQINNIDSSTCTTHNLFSSLFLFVLFGCCFFYIGYASMLNFWSCSVFFLYEIYFTQKWELFAHFCALEIQWPCAGRNEKCSHTHTHTWYYQYMCREVWEQCWQEERCEKRAEKTKQHAKGMEAKKTAATFRISEFDLREWAETYQKRGKRIKNESNDTRSLPATMYTYVYMLWLVCTCTCNTPNRSIYERCTNQVHFFSLRFHLFLYLSTNSDNFAFYSCTNPDLPNNLILFRIVEECQLHCCIFIA